MSIAIEIEKSITGAAWIREMFEQANRLKEEYGEADVFDLSIGNPVVEPPTEFFQALYQLLDARPAGVHRYMPNAGFPETRAFLAEELTARTGIDFSYDDVVMSVGAGGGLNVVLKALLDPGDELVGLAPYFPDYGAYVNNHNGIFKVAQTDSVFQIDVSEIERQLSSRTKVVMINSPNNPTGVVYPQTVLDELGRLLAKKERQFGRSIYLLSDEPYQKIIYDDCVNCNIFASHRNSVLVTSHSKDLALPGERIGYIAIHPEMDKRQDMQNALSVATRMLGFVNAPALMQRLLPLLKNITVPITTYQRLRDLLYNSLTKMGFSVVRPQGAFYLFPKSPLENDIEFVNHARDEKLLLVPGTGFGKPGFFRISYCHSEEMIVRSLQRFEVIAQKYK